MTEPKCIETIYTPNPVELEWPSSEAEHSPEDIVRSQNYIRPYLEDIFEKYGATNLEELLSKDERYDDIVYDLNELFSKFNESFDKEYLPTIYVGEIEDWHRAITLSMTNSGKIVVADNFGVSVFSPEEDGSYKKNDVIPHGEVCLTDCVITPSDKIVVWGSLTVNIFSVLNGNPYKEAAIREDVHRYNIINRVLITPSEDLVLVDNWGFKIFSPQNDGSYPETFSEKYKKDKVKYATITSSGQIFIVHGNKLDIFSPQENDENIQKKILKFLPPQKRDGYKKKQIKIEADKNREITQLFVTPSEKIIERGSCSDAEYISIYSPTSNGEYELKYYDRNGDRCIEDLVVNSKEEVVERGYYRTDSGLRGMDYVRILVQQKDRSYKSRSVRGIRGTVEALFITPFDEIVIGGNDTDPRSGIWRGYISIFTRQGEGFYEIMQIQELEDIFENFNCTDTGEIVMSAGDVNNRSKSYITILEKKHRK